jgi:hypothetical protein
LGRKFRRARRRHSSLLAWTLTVLLEMIDQPEGCLLLIKAAVQEKPLGSGSLRFGWDATGKRISAPTHIANPRDGVRRTVSAATTTSPNQKSFSVFSVKFRCVKEPPSAPWKSAWKQGGEAGCEEGCASCAGR